MKNKSKKKKQKKAKKARSSRVPRLLKPIKETNKEKALRLAKELDLVLKKC